MRTRLAAGVFVVLIILPAWVLGVGELPSNGSFFGLDACGALSKVKW